MKIVAYSAQRCKFNFFHSFKVVAEKDSVTYSKCQKCGTRKADGPADNIRINWLIGKINRVVKRSTKKDQEVNDET